MVSEESTDDVKTRALMFYPLASLKGICPPSNRLFNLNGEVSTARPKQINATLAPT
jgi:hypothetical protein